MNTIRGLDAAGFVACTLAATLTAALFVAWSATTCSSSCGEWLAPWTFEGGRCRCVAPAGTFDPTTRESVQWDP